MEEANLLHARRTARRHSWWDSVISAMQGLRVLYEYQGRLSEWSRLVAEITPDYCTPDDAPIPGREDQYTLVMGYRVALPDHDRDLSRAAALQEKLVAWDRQRAAPSSPSPPAPPSTPTNATASARWPCSCTLGQILQDARQPRLRGSVRGNHSYTQRIEDPAAEAMAHYNLGHTYMQIPAIRNLDAAEAAYQRSWPC